ncbi:MAG TPA: hypothetical protein VML96_05655, partial [Egibacteraceae bacterium]|nr:hypothetical protein [Egibacteraceae bacterium]
HAATRWEARVGQVFAAILIAGGLWGVLGGSVPADAPLVARVILRGDLWQILIGFFLFRGASEAYASAAARERLTGRTVRELMGSVPPALPSDLALDEALVRVQERPSLLWPVGAPIVGGLTLAQIDGVPEHLWHATSVIDVAHAADRVTISADAGLDVVLERLSAAPGGMLIVVEGGRAVGLVTPSLVAGLTL